MRELKPSTWGVQVDKSKAKETYPLRGTVFPKESGLNYSPKEKSVSGNNNLSTSTHNYGSISCK